VRGQGRLRRVAGGYLAEVQQEKHCSKGTTGSKTLKKPGTWHVPVLREVALVPPKDTLPSLWSAKNRQKPQAQTPQ
jgi:hypothetical protein